jgi:hypothetical protein
MYNCCLCRKGLGERKGPTTTTANNKDIDTGGDSLSKTTIRPVVTTKCGHLFHWDCVHAQFEKEGNGGN